MFRIFSLIVLATVALAAPCVSSEPSVPKIDVGFGNCIETIGVGLVPTANVIGLVPESFTPVGINEPFTPLVVRSAKCDMTIFGRRQLQKSIVQIGLVIVPPDGSGDINNYTLYYYTDDVRLAFLLSLAGVDAQYVPSLQYRVSSDGVNVRVPFPGLPRLSLIGDVVPSQQPAGGFVANWWKECRWGDVKMQTTVPVIKIGGADLEVTTPPNSQLATVAGTSVIQFPLIQQFNTFDTATLEISIK